LKRSTILALVMVCILLTMLVVAQAAVAQHTEPNCDLEAVIKHQDEHAQELANFAEEAETDLDAALAKLYRTAIAYQALAAECGFTNQAEVEATHEAEHAGDATHVHGEAEEAEVLAMARSIGDPEQGKILFNTVRPEVSFACATCHRVDSTETLVGPGLLGISDHAHNHTAAAPASNDGHSDHNSAATPAPTDSMSGMNMGEATAETTDTPEQALAESVEFLRTSITNPSASVMTGFPDNLMPKVYGTIFTEEEINNLIAYLLTLD